MGGGEDEEDEQTLELSLTFGAEFDAAADYSHLSDFLQDAALSALRQLGQGASSAFARAPWQQTSHTGYQKRTHTVRLEMPYASTCRNVSSKQMQVHRNKLTGAVASSLI